jgi:hypothetical protein
MLKALYLISSSHTHTHTQTRLFEKFTSGILGVQANDVRTTEMLCCFAIVQEQLHFIRTCFSLQSLNFL